MVIVKLNRKHEESSLQLVKMVTMINERVLIIEDDEDITDVLTAVLTDAGYSVTTINETPDIVQTVMEFSPAIVITDYILNGINGGEYCSELKRNPHTSHLPVIILSGYGKVLDSLGHYGADRIIEKPFDNEELCSAIAQLINLQHAKPKGT